MKSINVTHHINRTKVKYRMIISIDAKIIWQNLTLVYDKKKKTLSKLGREASHLNIVKAIFQKPTVNITFSSKNN